ncbi:MAG: FkbM family methyltransferase [Armatimonadota bacterium]
MILPIARRIVHTLRRHRLRAMAGQTGWQRVPAGFWMLIDPKEWLGRTVMMGYYESHLVFCIQQLVHLGDICLDIGAHQGYISMHMARRAGSTGCVIAIEPTRVAFERLVGHIERNRFNNIIAVQVAASDAPSTLEIWFNPEECGHSSVYNKSEVSVLERVQAKPVDLIVREVLGENRWEQIAFVKIDVEGYEPPVLDGMKQVLSQSQPVIWIEVNPPVLAKGGYRANDIEQRLDAFGYRFFMPYFHRNALGIPSLRLEPCADLETALGGKMTDMVAVIPESKGWHRIQNSKIRFTYGEQTYG